MVVVAALAGRPVGVRRRDKTDLAANEIGRESRQPMVLPLCRTVLEGHVPAFNEAGFAEPAMKGAYEIRRFVIGCAIEKAVYFEVTEVGAGFGQCLVGEPDCESNEPVIALGRATEGRPYLPPSGRAVSTAAYFDPSQSTTSRATKFLTKG
jgi:hypothetical protein